ncbi:hypothetical protein V2I01_34455 [Micromonospora sp. BRA006-A]|nr:hypothetical protein [Micromonospora sp. BRA006-A]
MGLALAGLLLLAYAFVVRRARGATRPPTSRRDSPLPATPQASTDVPAAVAPSPRGGPFPPAGQAFFGVMTDKGPYDFAPVDRFAEAAGRAPQVMLFGADWASAAFDRSLFDRIAERGMMPMLGWEPWDHTVDKAARRTELTDRQIDRLRATQPDYRLSRIARGDFDAYLRSWPTAAVAGLPGRDPLRARDERRLVPLVRAGQRQPPRRLRPGLAARPRRLRRGRRHERHLGVGRTPAGTRRPPGSPGSTRATSTSTGWASPATTAAARSPRRTGRSTRSSARRSRRSARSPASRSWSPRPAPPTPPGTRRGGSGTRSAPCPAIRA